MAAKRICNDEDRRDKTVLYIGIIMLIVTLAANAFALIETRHLRSESARLDVCTINVIEALRVRAVFQNDIRETDEVDQRNMNRLVNKVSAAKSEAEAAPALVEYNRVAKANAQRRAGYRAAQAKYKFPELKDCTGKANNDRSIR